MVAHAFNPSTREAEAGKSLQIRDQPGLQELVPGELGLLLRETLSKQTNKQTNLRTNVRPKPVLFVYKIRF